MFSILPDEKESVKQVSYHSFFPSTDIFGFCIFKCKLGFREKMREKERDSRNKSYKSSNDLR